MDDKINSKQWAYHKRGRKKINKHVKTCILSANYISFKGRSNELNTIQYVGYRITKNNVNGTKQNNRAKRKIENIMEVKHYMKYIEEKQQTTHDVTEINTKL
eukprot:76707_1